jgi:hypothetical protein
VLWFFVSKRYCRTFALNFAGCGCINCILGKYDATILDIGQADIHNTLSLGILFMQSQK